MPRLRSALAAIAFVSAAAAADAPSVVGKGGPGASDDHDEWRPPAAVLTASATWNSELGPEAMLRPQWRYDRDGDKLGELQAHGVGIEIGLSTRAFSLLLAHTSAFAQDRFFGLETTVAVGWTRLFHDGSQLDSGDDAVRVALQAVEQVLILAPTLELGLLHAHGDTAGYLAGGLSFRF